MALFLFSGAFSEIEKEFCRSFLKTIETRRDPLHQTYLVVVPSATLRNHLLAALYDAGCSSLSGVRIVSLNGLAQEIVLDTLEPRTSILDDSIYFALAIQLSARKVGLKHFEAYRTAKGVLSTFRDMVDGLLTPELLEDVLEQSHADPEMKPHLKSLNEMLFLYRTFHQMIQNNRVVNIQFASAIASTNLSTWLQAREICGVDVYGFYDATPAQFELIETLSRHVNSGGGPVNLYFPFLVDPSLRVEQSAEYGQDFFDAIYSMTASLGGTFERLPLIEKSASNGLETLLFQDQLPIASEAARIFIEISNSGSPYEEAWTVAKEILKLVLEKDVRFDQIAVVARSLDTIRTVLEHVFRENKIPHSMPVEPILSSTAASHFVHLLLSTRQSHLNHNLVFELLCSPLLKEPFSPPGIIRELLETLFITNSNDWDRLKPLTNSEKKLPDIFELDEEDPRVLHYRRGASYLCQMKDSLEQIPMRGTLQDFCRSLTRLIRDLANPNQYLEAGGQDLELLLQRLGDLQLENEFNLNEFVEIFRDYLSTTSVKGEVIPAESMVTMQDIMNLRGTSFDYVFIIGLNQDVFPMRASEDPFLADLIRRYIRENAGAGPHPKRRLRTKSAPESASSGSSESSDEELLLFTLALRSAKKRLFLSYQRADSDGRKKTPSIYVEEILRLLTNNTANNNDSVRQIPKHPSKRFERNFLPSIHECATLLERFSPAEVIHHLYGLQPPYVTATVGFAQKLNTMDRTLAAEIDGSLPNAPDLWKVTRDSKLRFSYSRIKSYVQCPFSFYSDRILKLESSPFQPSEIPHDLTALVKGRIAENVAKEAILKLSAGKVSIEEAIASAETKVRRKYSPYLQKILLDAYLVQFSRAAQILVELLAKEGYDFARAEVPGRNYMPEIKLLEDSESSLWIYGIPDLLFYGNKKLIGEMKWGAAATAETADAMFKRGELQFCFYPELERQHRQLLETTGFRYFRLNMFAELGSPTLLEENLRMLSAPSRIDTTMRIFGLAPTDEDVAKNFKKLNDVGKGILSGEFHIMEDPNDYFSPCTSCRFILICRRTHSATLLRAKKEPVHEQ